MQHKDVQEMVILKYGVGGSKETSMGTVLGRQEIQISKH